MEGPHEVGLEEEEEEERKDSRAGLFFCKLAKLTRRAISSGKIIALWRESRVFDVSAVFPCFFIKLFAQNDSLPRQVTL